MKIKVSKKQIKENYTNIISVSYCDLQTLLKFEDAIYYSSGVYGWSCDYYEIDRNTIISTGYNTLDSTIKFDYDIIRKYEEKARKINWRQDYKTVKAEHTKLLNQLIKEIKKGVEE